MCSLPLINRAEAELATDKVRNEIYTAGVAARLDAVLSRSSSGYMFDSFPDDTFAGSIATKVEEWVFLLAVEALDGVA